MPIACLRLSKRVKRNRNHFEEFTLALHILFRWVIAATMVAVLSVSLSCKPVIKASRPGYIVGPQNDISTFSKEDEERIEPDVVNAAVLIITKISESRKKFCSGVLIAPAGGEKHLRVLTNHHCFADVSKEGEVSARILPTACNETTIYAGLRTDTKKTSKVDCVEGSLRSDSAADIAVFSLAEDLPSQFKPLSLWTGEKGAPGKKALIVHYPDIPQNAVNDPESGFRIPSLATTLDDCVSKGLFPADEWNLDRSLPYGLKHTCDLVHGSSGSPLIEAESNTILGINWGGIKVDYGNRSETVNVATRADVIEAFLKGKLDQFKENMDGEQNSSDAKVAERERADQKQKDPLKKTFCGTISRTNGTLSWLWFFIPLLPLLFSFRRSMRSEKHLS